MGNHKLTRDTTFPTLPWNQGQHRLRFMRQSTPSHAALVQYILFLLCMRVCDGVEHMCSSRPVEWGDSFGNRFYSYRTVGSGLWPRSSGLRGQGLTSGPSPPPLRFQAHDHNDDPNQRCDGETGKTQWIFFIMKSLTEGFQLKKFILRNGISSFFQNCHFFSSKI